LNGGALRWLLETLLTAAFVDQANLNLLQKIAQEVFAMATDGLLLIGFLEANAAANYLRERCSFATRPTGRALREKWECARAKVKERAPWVGTPRFIEVPKDHKEYLDNVQKRDDFDQVVQGMPWRFRQVEIDPLLAYQVDVDFGRVAKSCQGLPTNPSLGSLLSRCLPTAKEDALCKWRGSPTGKGIVLETENPNVCPRKVEYWGVDAKDDLHLAGVKFGTRSPLTQVVQLGDYIYLKNGYHRAYGIRQLGAAFMPCLWLQASRFDQVADDPSKVIPSVTLHSSNPPTLGHFTNGFAYPAKLRTRVTAYEISYNYCGYWQD
jgi:hypothetical protein